MGRSFEVRKASMAKTAGAKIKVYSKYGKEIYMCAKNGGSDPDMNLSLRHLITKAKKDQVPSHVIEKAIDKANGGGGEDYQPARYEGFGPGGISVIVDCLTDNGNRTFQDVRQCFVKTGAKIGTPGVVAHMFDHQAVFQFKGEDEEAILEALMMADCDVTDIELEDGVITIYAPNTEFFKVKTALNTEYPDLVIDVEEITFVPQNYSPVPEEDAEKFQKFLDMLDDCDDVQQVYHNAEL
ncbi:transcriptional regulator [Vibrio navarrensis]|jgi:YebC/PmpR family DNA-binding regulatory protein|uniref:Probable transcriptional regulatory protein EA26_08495 n=2 Tax=Vibrio TaxID=662 RepID=A0A099LSZ2_9VIBR|nr:MULTISPECIES: YebC/PmpR family DNA-binding transcriptional regulator [Vibrio]EGR2795338.1 YebC/PmpR family DNA-binding transcriptional regulator [Vibrio navarrensis]EJK2113903.1 YebC/PmpR family DNA-binding transcriptional regulator [Vibrio navarrensis]EJL6393465.1 YebC/PmpR family DNA-binding transcriptional regulator [Vibrio navarrensis]EJL6398711.1 YebC/PmpR family DNA-binding transcriptional regulator [Vibrio navarrensis]EJL6566063.1 YebC/PmpR family DNA-binding transcriptional regulato